jgi:hypothetical protein
MDRLCRSPQVPSAAANPSVFWLRVSDARLRRGRGIDREDHTHGLCRN